MNIPDDIIYRVAVFLVQTMNDGQYSLGRGQYRQRLKWCCWHGCFENNKPSKSEGVWTLVGSGEGFEPFRLLEFDTNLEDLMT